MTDDEIEKLLLDDGFTEKQLNELREIKKQCKVNYLIQLRELKKEFLEVVRINVFSLLFFIINILVFKGDLLVSFSIFLLIIVITCLFSPVHFKYKAFFFLRNYSINDKS